MTTVVLADDHQLLRQAVRRALEDAGFAVLGEAGDGEEASNLAGRLQPDVVVMDVTMPVLDGIRATRRIRELAPGARVVMLTMHGEESLLADAIDAGASAFLTKDCSLQEVVKAVRSAADGDVMLSPDLAASLLDQFRDPAADTPAPSPLTKREEEILQLVADGRSTTEVARELFISAKTVKNHLASIYVKLDARDRTQAVLSGVRMGIVHLR
ncbi:MAG TPA: response regulator transcription factor [Acidimicrobiia bacterium]|jgi:DNA-binding NarL/FixJ family response regulator